MMTGRKMTLFELNSILSDVIERGMPGDYWVEAEIAELREVGGHCYLELIEKDKKTNTPIAKASAKCWRTQWALVKSFFMQAVQKPLANGMKVLVKVYPQFHPNYGFSWIVNDIDPAYSLGDMALKRQQIIAQLKEEGVFDANKELDLPLFTQRIAVVSSANAAGYGDFCNHLSENEFGYAFLTSLFPAVMQGEGVEQSIIEALNAIFDRLDEFDCVVITRGGGATSDLSGFDAIELARNVANFPLPVITAIGHDRDESVLDMISNVRVKTPTAAAAFLIDRLHHVDARVDDLGSRITKVVEHRIQNEKMRIQHLSVRIPSLFSVVKMTQEARLRQTLHVIETRISRKIQGETHRLDSFHEHLLHLTSEKVHKEKYRIEILSQKIDAQDPQRILDRGYSITFSQGKAVTSSSLVKPGTVVETRLKDGSFTSEVK